MERINNGIQGNMTTRTQIDAPITGEEPPNESAILESRMDSNKAVEKLEMAITVGLKRFTDKCIRYLIVAAVAVVVSIKALDLLFG